MGPLRMKKLRGNWVLWCTAIYLLLVNKLPLGYRYPTRVWIAVIRFIYTYHQYKWPKFTRFQRAQVIFYVIHCATRLKGREHTTCFSTNKLAKKYKLGGGGVWPSDSLYNCHMYFFLCVILNFYISFIVYTLPSILQYIAMLI